MKNVDVYLEDFVLLSHVGDSLPPKEWVLGQVTAIDEPVMCVRHVAAATRKGALRWISQIRFVDEIIAAGAREEMQELLRACIAAAMAPEQAIEALSARHGKELCAAHAIRINAVQKILAGTKRRDRYER